jgi:UDP-N-acetylmuramoyl-tripeptide--D-alanyl-D-alanine ligase
VKVNGLELPLSVLGALGNQHVYPLLVAVAVVNALGFDINKSIPVLIGHESPRGRMKIIQGKNNSIIIDDTYNSSPIAVEEALNALSKLETKGKKIAVLGDMFELGTYTEREHLRIGKIAESVVDVLVTIGLRAEDFINGAVEEGMDKNKTHTFSDSEQAIKYLNKHVGENDIVLIKGSQGMRLEKIVKDLMLEPEKAKDLLVRQELEWEVR